MSSGASTSKMRFPTWPVDGVNVGGGGGVGGGEQSALRQRASVFRERVSLRGGHVLGWGGTGMEGRGGCSFSVHTSCGVLHGKVHTMGAGSPRELATPEQGRSHEDRQTPLLCFLGHTETTRLCVAGD